MKKTALTALIMSSVLLTACGNDGSDGKNGTNGTDGTNGSNGSNGSNGANGQTSLIMQQALALGDQHCWMGGTAVQSGLDANSNSLLDASEINQASTLCQPNAFAFAGVRLPYQSISYTSSDYIAANVDLRNGGYGSDMTAHPSNPMQFYALTDRGPNADFTGDQGDGKMFITPDYTPRIGLFEVQANNQVRQLKTILLRRPDGTAVTGLPNPVGLGGTKELPYDASGKVLAVDPNQPYDANSNPSRTDDYGIDSEGLVAMPDGTFWVSDEYGPHIVHFNADGIEIGRINAFANDSRDTFHLPAEFAKRRANRGMEGLTVTPDHKTLVGIMQSTLSNPDKSVNKLTVTRIVTINLETGKVAQYLYKQEIAANSNSAIVALSATSFLVLERDGNFYKDSPEVMKHVYKISLTGATNLEDVAETDSIKQDASLGLTINGKTLEQVELADGWAGLTAAGITPVSKALVLDMGAQVNYAHDKMEGLWLINPTRLGVINDDDFAVESLNNQVVQKHLDKAKTRIDGSTLYVIDGLDLSAAP